MIETIIVGQGMAGSVLAWKLHQRGHSLRIVDDAHATSASRVAAGMVNPVQGQRLNLAWRIEDCLPVARKFFAEMSDTFGRTFFHETSILRLVDSPREGEFLKQRFDDERFNPFLGDFMGPGENAPIADEYGGLFIHHSGYVETNPLLDCLQDYFQSEGLLCNAKFNHEELKVQADYVQWRDINAQRIIFAEGFRILENPWFADFSFQPNKGQILTLASGRRFPSHPINRSKWIIPLPDGTAWCGSTYGRGQTDMQVTEDGCAEIFEKVARILPQHQLTVIGHRAGVRCAAIDHIPRAGFHPDQPRIGVFNGFGSKGNVFIPWLAQRFTEHIATGAPLPEECDLRLNPPTRSSRRK